MYIFVTAESNMPKKQAPQDPGTPNSHGQHFHDNSSPVAEEKPAQRNETSMHELNMSDDEGDRPIILYVLMSLIVMIISIYFVGDRQYSSGARSSRNKGKNSRHMFDDSKEDPLSGS